MGTKAYLMITVAQEFCHEGLAELTRELKAMPEVKAVEPVRGTCDFLVQVEVPIRVILVANKIMAKEWVKHLNVLTVQPTEPQEHPKPVHAEATRPELRRQRELHPVFGK